MSAAGHRVCRCCTNCWIHKVNRNEKLSTSVVCKRISGGGHIVACLTFFSGFLFSWWVFWAPNLWSLTAGNHSNEFTHTNTHTHTHTQTLSQNNIWILNILFIFLTTVENYLKLKKGAADEKTAIEQIISTPHIVIDLARSHLSSGSFTSW